MRADMTINEFAEKILGYKLMQWQKDILHILEHHEDQPIRMCINYPRRNGWKTVKEVYRIWKANETRA